MKVPAFIVTLPESSERYESILRELAHYDFIEIIPIEGVRGGLLSDVACRLLTRNKWSVNHKGTLGCFLSHTRVWQLPVRLTTVAKRAEKETVLCDNNLETPANLLR